MFSLWRMHPVSIEYFFLDTALYFQTSCILGIIILAVTRLIYRKLKCYRCDDFKLKLPYWNFVLQKNSMTQIYFPPYCHTRPILKFQPSWKSGKSQLARWATKWHYFLNSYDLKIIKWNISDTTDKIFLLSLKYYFTNN